MIDFPQPMQAQAPPEPPDEDPIKALQHAIFNAAKNADASKDPEAVAKYLQGAFFAAQAIDKLTPQAPDPGKEALTVQGQAVELHKHLTQLQHDADQQALQREHDLAKAELSAAESSAPKGKMGATDG